MSEYTKGPWRVEADMRSNRIGDMWSDDGYEEYCAGYNIVAEDGAEIVGCEGIIDEDDTNARLMASAPDLLEALIALRDACIGMAPDCAEQVENAISKALGNNLTP